MNPDLSSLPREELEVKITALLLGELDETEAAALREWLAGDAELSRLRAELAQTLRLLREAVSRPAEPTAATLLPRMSEARRAALLAQLGTPPAGGDSSGDQAPAPAAPAVVPAVPSVVSVDFSADRASGRQRSTTWLTLAACLIALLGAASIWLAGPEIGASRSLALLEARAKSKGVSARFSTRTGLTREEAPAAGGDFGFVTNGRAEAGAPMNNLALGFETKDREGLEVNKSEGRPVVVTGSLTPPPAPVAPMPMPPGAAPALPPTGQPQEFRMSPELMNRYGLTPRGGRAAGAGAAQPGGGGGGFGGGGGGGGLGGAGMAGIPAPGPVNGPQSAPMGGAAPARANALPSDGKAGGLTTGLASKPADPTGLDGRPESRLALGRSGGTVDAPAAAAAADSKRWYFSEKQSAGAEPAAVTRSDLADKVEAVSVPDSSVVSFALPVNGGVAPSPKELPVLLANEFAPATTPLVAPAAAPVALGAAVANQAPTLGDEAKLGRLFKNNGSGSFEKAGSSDRPAAVPATEPPAYSVAATKDRSLASDDLNADAIAPAAPVAPGAPTVFSRSAAREGGSVGAIIPGPQGLTRGGEAVRQLQEAEGLKRLDSAAAGVPATDDLSRRAPQAGQVNRGLTRLADKLADFDANGLTDLFVAAGSLPQAGAADKAGLTEQLGEVAAPQAIETAGRRKADDQGAQRLRLAEAAEKENLSKFGAFTAGKPAMAARPEAATETKAKVKVDAASIQQMAGEKKLPELRARLSQEAIEAKPPAPAPVPAAVPQPEIAAAENAFSTFSLNVSDVSFKLAGASLEQGAMPAPGAIRTEEFLNAFQYRDPEPAPGMPVAFAWERSQYPFAHNRDMLRLAVRTAARGREAGRPLNLVLAVDNSGSMERADRVQILRETMRTLAGQLQPADQVSLVSFARTARLWLDALPGNRANELADAVAGLTPEGGTNLEDALRVAYETALKHFVPNGVNRVVLLTDGAANLGDVQPDSLKRNVESYRKRGVALDCFGIGWEGFNDDLLETLSRNGDGRYGFVNAPEEAATEFAGQLAGALQVAASDVKVQVEFNPRRVNSWRQVGYAKHQLTKEQFRDNTVDAAELGAAESGNALYVIENNSRGEGPIATVRVRYKVPSTGVYEEHEWLVPFTGASQSLEQSTPAMRLATTSAAFSEWLASNPFAAEVSTDRLLSYLSGVPAAFQPDPRPARLEWMIRQAKSLSGR